LTLLLALLSMSVYAVEAWYLTGYLMVVGGVGLLFREVRHSPWFWLTLFLGPLAYLMFNWYETGNHLFLMAQWMLALTLALFAKDRDKAITLSSRFLIGTVFALASLWKWISPDFASGSFFNFFFLHDFRMGPVAPLFSSLQLEDIRHNAQAVMALSKQPTEVLLYLKSDPVIPIVSRYLALGAGILETLVAVLFLLPSRQLSGWRDASLMVFVCGTYLIAPVSVFGVLLSAMGFAQAQHGLTRLGYLVLFFVVQVMGWRLWLVSVN
jgi:hypothetical protein